MRWKILLVLGAILFGACTHKNVASSLSGDDLIILKGARLIDGLGAPARDNVNIILRHDRILAIQDAMEPVPEKAKVLELQGKTIIPALMSSHVHLGMTNGVEAGSRQVTEENDLRQLYKFSKYGVAGVLSLGTDLDFIYKIRENSQRVDSTLPLVLTAGRGFGVPGGAPPATMGIDQVYRPKNAAEAKKQVAELASKKPNVIKIWVDDFDHSMKKKMEPEIYRAIIQEAHAHKIPVAAHVYYLADAKLLAQEGVDIFAHSVRDQAVDMELISLMKLHNTAYIPTLALDDAFFVYAEKPSWMRESFFQGALDPGVEQWLQKSYKPKSSSRDDLKMAQQNAMALFKSGIVIGLGTDSGANQMRIQGFAEHRELQLLVEAGFTPLEAIRIGTVNNANIMGIAKDYAGIAPNMKANLLVLDADPSEDITNTQKIHSVIINGKLIERR
ncbi:amidohydrolase family protein [Bdellovibrio sp. SKB1291214]|uniref:amidohydrolase family protein n=1 Tax=Bdellovibrio sp. SKB1291214 TaxID=1732569 RepID=UPI000B5180E7|nr:amidohydrolase family protein [Bdellovibrio sp. SKB1291214]UYL07361.1 amidohydrolase family protein [Bdellovibrio sp. SKB1291214]